VAELDAVVFEFVLGGCLLYFGRKGIEALNVRHLVGLEVLIEGFFLEDPLPIDGLKNFLFSHAIREEVIINFLLYF